MDPIIIEKCEQFQKSYMHKNNRLLTQIPTKGAVLSEDIGIRRRKLRRYFSAGAIIFVIGLAFWAIPSVVIGGLNNRINQLSLKGGLSEAEQNLLTNLYWSRSWWEMTQITISNPLTIIILVIGLLLIAYGFIYRFT